MVIIVATSARHHLIIARQHRLALPVSHERVSISEGARKLVLLALELKESTSYPYNSLQVLQYSTILYYHGTILALACNDIN
jgi:hypothetical protein